MQIVRVSVFCVLAVCLGVLSFDFAGVQKIQYWLFLLHGRRVEVGQFEVRVAKGWRLEDKRMKAGQYLASVAPVAQVGRCPARLIFSTRMQGMFDHLPSDLPKYKSPAGDFILLAPNENASGYASEPTEYGTAVIQNDLLVEHRCLRDLDAIEAVTKK
jgi:hypothetical protein